MPTCQFFGLFVYIFTHPPEHLFFLPTSISHQWRHRFPSSISPPPLFHLPQKKNKKILTCNQNGVSNLLRVCRVTWIDPQYVFFSCVSRSGSRTVVPKKGAWSSWARWAHGGTRFSGARGGWGRWWTDWSPGSSSPTGPSLTMEVCVPSSSFS